MAFSNDGAKMFVIGSAKNDINEYTLSTPFDVSTASHNDGEKFSVSVQVISSTGMAFSNDGAKMFVLDNSGDDVNQYTLSSVYPIKVPDTKSPVITLEGSNLATITVGGTYTDAGATCKDNVDATRYLPKRNR